MEQQELKQLYDLTREVRKINILLSVLKGALAAQTCSTREMQKSFLERLDQLELECVSADPELQKPEIVDRVLKLGIPFGRS